MPRTVPEAAAELTEQAAAKAAAATGPAGYLKSSVLAGVYVGIAVVLLVSVSAPLAAAGSPVTRLVQGAVFGLALTLVVFAGAELFTGNVMVMAHGISRRSTGWRSAGTVGALSLVGNAIGSLALAGAVHLSGVLSAAPGPTGSSPAVALLDSMVDGKTAATGPQLFWRAVLCNALVCLAVWMATRAATDGAKLMVLWWGLLAFIGSGFEHSVANMTIFALGVLDGSATVSQLFANLAWTVPGNLLGGGAVVGLGYAWLGGSRAPATAGAPVEAVPAAPSPVVANGSRVLDLAAD
jgi:nitrite transporter